MSCRVCDITNQKFGRLTVTAQSGRDKWGQVLWNCLCDCGNTLTVVSNNLRNNHTTSCGCWRNEATGRANTKHGHTYRLTTSGTRATSREYRSWQGMKKRCLDLKHKWYKNYGGRGINICARWVDSFENFLADMGERPARFTLDRINVNGNYEPSNCRWASWQTQARNKR